MVSTYSWMPSSQAMRAAIDLREKPSCTRAARATMAKATGRGHTAARAIFQLKASSPRAMTTVETQGQTKWDWLVSSTAQSFMMEAVRSARSFFPKKDRGSRRSCSARLTRRTPVST